MQRFVHGGNIYEEGPAQGWLDFSANINPLGLSSPVREAIAAHIDDIVHYPDPAARRLRHALQQTYGVLPEHLILGNGAAELFYLFFHTFRPQQTLLPVPSFSEYERAALSAGRKITYFELSPEQDFRLSVARLKEALPQNGCVILGNPNNPTGTMVEKNDLLELAAAAAKQKTWLVVDESFLDFLPDDSPYTLMEEVSSLPYVFLIRSLTKFYALPGLRLGFGAARKENIAAMEQGKDVWNVNLLAQEAGVVALADESYPQASRQMVDKERRFLSAALAEMPGIRVYPTQVNFILLDIHGTGLTSAELTSRMRSRGILIRDCGNYPGLDGSSYVRLAVRNHAENMMMLERLETILV